MCTTTRNDARAFTAGWPVSILAACLGLAAGPSHAQIAINVGAGFADGGNAVAIDAAGNTCLTGVFGQTADFDPGPGVLNLTAPSGLYNFIASYDASGAVNYAFAFPSSSSSLSDRGIAIDDSGNVFVTGVFSGLADFDPGPGETILNAALSNVFVASYDVAGGLRFAFNLPNDTPGTLEFGTGLGLDDAGNLYVTGFFPGTTDFDPTAGEFLLESNGNTDIFLASYTNDGGGLRFAISVGGSFGDRALGIAVDPSGTSYLTGAFRDTVDFDPDTGLANLSAVGNEDLFLASYDGSGALRYAVGLGGGATDIGRGVAVDGAGNAFVTGEFQATADFDPGPGQFDLTSAGNEDLFLASYTGTGALRFAFAIGEQNSDIGYGVVVGPDGDAYITGSFKNSPDFDPGPGVRDLTAISAEDAFVARYTNNGALVNAYSFSTTTASDISGRALALDPAGRVGVVGNFGGTVDFDPGAGEILRTSGGASDIFYSSYTLDATDTDADGVIDALDNCTQIANANQRDTNGDGYGNACDTDLNNDGITNPVDLGIFRAVFFTADADADFNGDGIVNPIDLGTLRAFFFLPPGPSALAP